MGLCSGQRQDQQQYSTQSTTFKQCLETSPPSSLPTLWWPSTSPRRDGTKSRTSRPRPVASPSPRLVPAPLSSPSSSLTWTLRRLLATLSPECQFTPPESELVATLMDLVCPPASPSSREWTWRS